jgi:predicted nucleic acid-binding protein
MTPISKSKLIRVYADTSVFGGLFDEEFETASKAFFFAVKKGSFKLITSELVREEIQVGPQKVLDVFEEFLVIAEIAEVSDSVLELQQSYVEAGIVSERCATDAMHVALATVSNADVIISWNFKHIVNFQKIPLYNAVNTLNRFGKIAIYSPLEVIEDED